jgi:hypothetical protein
MPNKRSVEYWHNKAEEARVIARTMRNETTKQIMLRIAADCDRLARPAMDGQSLTEKIIDQETA